MKGYHIEVVTLSTTPTVSFIKNTIIDYYQNSDPPLEFVLLIGDQNGGNVAIPAPTIQHPDRPEEDDVTDHPYTLLDGSNDYFSDIFIGRLSVSTSIEAGVILNKIINYEKNPFVFYDDWYLKMLSVGGNFNDSGPAPITPCQTAWWIADYFLEHGFTQADTILYWGPGDLNPGNANEINNSINDGRLFVSYRGWADANGWQHPYYTIPNIEDLENNWMLPVVTSFVCNTGDFGSPVNPCFGEKFIRFGNVTNGGGAVAFLGPSDLYTNTNYNNAISSGFYEGLWEGGAVKFAAATNYGKMTLYEGFPNKREWGDYVPFYFHVYNNLADPEMDMWRAIPLNLEINAPDELPIGAASIDVNVKSNGSNINNAYVTVLYDDELIAADYTDENGNVSLAFDPLEAGSVTVTATKYGYDPPVKQIPVQAQNYVGYLSHIISSESNPDGNLNPGESAILQVTVKNFGTQTQSNVSASMTTDYPYIQSLSPASISLGSINAGDTDIASFDIILADNAPSKSVIEFVLTCQSASGSYESKFELVVDGSNLLIESVSIFNLTPEQDEEVDITLKNIADFTASGVSVSLYSFDESVIIIDGNANYGDILPGQSVINADPLIIRTAAGAYTGRMLQMRLEVTPTTGTIQTLTFNLMIGEADSTCPGGPDPYGYFVYDDGDTDYNIAPTYNWIELDPNYGGSGEATRLFLKDDSSTFLPLPFDFQFYGETYDSITICSNGWVSFESTWMANFRNWDLPSPLGPPTLICAFWDDLKDTTDGVLDIYYWNDPTGRFIIEWSRVHNRFETLADRVETFELILYDPALQSGPTGDGDILVQFNHINDIDELNNYSTVGIENYNHQMGLEYVFSKNYDVNVTSKTLQNEMAVLFTTTPPDQYAGTNSPNRIVPARFSLSQNYPNPFNSSTAIVYEVATGGLTELKIFDVTGRLVNTLFSGYRSPGSYRALWTGVDQSGEPAASGIYIIRLSSGGEQESIKTILIK